MIIHNPTKESVSIAINGRVYTLEAGEQREGFSDKVAYIWKKTHGFLEVNPEEEEVIIINSSEGIQEATEVAEEAEESLLETTVKKVKGSKKKK